MKRKQISKFFKKYVFYIAMGIVSIGALTAIFLLPNKEGNVTNEPNPYAKNEAADSKVTEDLTPDDDNIIIDYDVPEVGSAEVPLTEEVEVPVQEDATVAAKDETRESEDEIKTETFDSTTASVMDEPFFAEGDLFSWPVSGKVVVPYSDESTKYWFSESLNQTMRTFGICIAAVEGEEVKATAQGTVTEILDDSSTLDLDMPYVGKTMILDHGNGYKSIYGFQNGSPNKDLLGQVVNVGDVLGTVGSPTGAFINAGDNIYLQVIRNKEVVSPLEFLEHSNQTASAEGVDTGFAK